MSGKVKHFQMTLWIIMQAYIVSKEEKKIRDDYDNLWITNIAIH